ncbi:MULTISPECIES: class I SAM-dependent DNA methyltransferase [Gemella]|uniref:class I SAM-dependent DNA methyltransferase n=1 Tax=Gemella TaxID=1378 RepID=UPI0007682A8D|nr:MULTISPECIES: class I SAM-dependent methyltransferase [Gemella]AME09937.1 methyltransferase [Gemella sp. oral taxon 928]AXI26076.1 class I SAM-dependent methyltransferase [Gemella sp. ND 6198]
MYKNLSVVYDKLMDVDYDTYKEIIREELGDKEDLLILDLGCGSGVLLTELKKYGGVFAIDNSEEMLALASQKESGVNYFVMNLLDIEKLNQSFNFIVSAFDVFNYLEDFQQFKTGLKGVYNSLEKGGKFIFDIHTPNKINTMIKNKVFAYDDDEISYIWFTYKTENNLEVENELTFFIKEKNNLYKKLEEYQRQRTYDICEVKKEIKNIGFKIKDYFCDFDRENKNYKNSERIIFVLEK